MHSLKDWVDRLQNEEGEDRRTYGWMHHHIFSTTIQGQWKEIDQLEGVEGYDLAYLRREGDASENWMRFGQSTGNARMKQHSHKMRCEVAEGAERKLVDLR